MIAPVASVIEPETPPPAGDRWRQWWLALFAVTMVLLAVVTVVSRNTGKSDSDPAAAPTFVAPAASAPASAAAPTSAAPSSTEPSRSPATSPSSAPIVESAPASLLVDPKILQISGSVPTHGSGDFRYATKRGAVFGTKGPLRRFRVAVEKGSGEDPDAFAEQVVSTLGDKRSWTGGGTLRLQMVNGDEQTDFTVYLATRDTAGDMCQRGGTNIRIGGVPYTSCRATGQAIINLDRYRKSSKPYLNAEVPLAIYRNYVINHEVGHELGHHHEGCPKAGGPAPVMVQQTLTVRGCVPYAWPRRNNKSFTGPHL